jgi:hypothetical protein
VSLICRAFELLADGEPLDRTGKHVLLAISLTSGVVAGFVGFFNPGQLWQQLRGENG